MNIRREPGYEFDKASLLEYNPMSFGGPPVTVQTVEEADELLLRDENESAIEAEILAAPPKLVYSKLILRFARKLLVAVMDKWDSHVLVIDRVAPPNWKDEPGSRILELCILHLAMSEITVLGTRPQIVINEAVDLAKRFCDGSAPRTINGCLRTFVNGFEETGLTPALEKQKVADKGILRVWKKRGFPIMVLDYVGKFWLVFCRMWKGEHMAVPNRRRGSYRWAGWRSGFDARLWRWLGCGAIVTARPCLDRIVSIWVKSFRSDIWLRRLDNGCAVPLDEGAASMVGGIV
ncbi:hypothetical protein ACLB2K_030625 [Fragaria x ananassa]